MGFVDEMRVKERRVQEFMERENLDALALSTVANFAWITCGGSNYVGIGTEVGVAAAVLTRDARYIVCDNIEAPRIRDEEVADKGFEIVSCPWYQGTRDALIRELANGTRIGSDAAMDGATNISGAFDPCRFSLTSEEVDRYRLLGRSVGECVDQTARDIQPGMTEHEIAGALDGRLICRGITPLVSLVAVDDRISRYRHPIHTDNRLERRAMLVTGARRWGLIVSMTRLVQFGAMPRDAAAKHAAVTRVDGALISGTVPGESMSRVFDRAVQIYAETGFGDEWRLHHQGGPTGYKGREFRVTSETTAAVLPSQAFAWNPSITGTKSEDTIIAADGGPEVISAIDGWPMLDVEIEGKTIPRPDILRRG